MLFVGYAWLLNPSHPCFRKVENTKLILRDPTNAQDARPSFSSDIVKTREQFQDINVDEICG